MATDNKTVNNFEREGLVFKTKFHRRYNAGDIRKDSSKKNIMRMKESEVFFGKKSASYLSYIARPNGTNKDDTKMLELKYPYARQGIVPMWDKSGTLTIKEFNEYKKHLCKCDVGISNVLSFSIPYRSKHIKNILDAKRFTDFAFKTQMKHLNLNPNDFHYLGAYHTDTPHYHIHYVIFPKNNNAVYTHYFWNNLSEMKKSMLKQYPNSNVVMTIEKDYFNTPFHTPEQKKSFYQPTPTLLLFFRNTFVSKKFSDYSSLGEKERQVVLSYLWKTFLTHSCKDMKKRLVSLDVNKREEICSIVYNKLVLYCYDSKKEQGKTNYRRDINKFMREERKMRKGEDYSPFQLLDEEYVNKKMKKELALWKLFERDRHTLATRKVIRPILVNESALVEVLNALRDITLDEHGIFSLSDRTFEIERPNEVIKEQPKVEKVKVKEPLTKHHIKKQKGR